jgi:hypothetical protein
MPIRNQSNLADCRVSAEDQIARAWSSTALDQLIEVALRRLVGVFEINKAMLYFTDACQRIAFPDEFGGHMLAIRDCPELTQYPSLPIGGRIGRW